MVDRRTVQEGAGERDPRHGGIVLWAERSASMLFNGAMGSLEPG